MAESDKKLFLLDAFALIYRAYFALNNNRHFNPINSKGFNTAAVLGFTNTLVEVLQNEKPSHIAVVFDAPSQTVRHEVYSEYKANREEMPEDIRSALPYIKDIIEAFNIPIVLLEGYEADDLIGTMAKMAEEKGFTTYMMTPDKDYGQLVSEHTFMYKPARQGNGAEIWGIPEICEKFEITDPSQVIDILGMWGDAVDNIPGIPGVGEKTAKKLVGEYGSIENLYEHTDDLKGKLKENVENNKEQALLSKHLATIITDAPIEFNEEELRREDMNEEKIYELFSDLEFRTLSKRVLNKEIMASAVPGTQMDMFSSMDNGGQGELSEMKNIENTDHHYELVDSTEKIEGLVNVLSSASAICFDTETTGLNSLEAELVGIAFSIESGKAYFVPTPESFEEAKSIAQQFSDIFEDTSKTLIAHNIKYDIEILNRYGISFGGRLYDTMIAHYLLHPDSKHNMDVLSEKYLGYRPVSIETLIGKKGKNQKSMRDVPYEDIKEYAAEDADITFQLYEKLQKELSESGLQPLFDDIEMPLVPVLVSMEEEGIKLDVETINKFSAELGEDLIRLEKQIKDLAGKDFNLDSPKQLGPILFEDLKITDKPKKTKTGQYSTSEDVLTLYKNDHEIIPAILEYRALKKLKSTYADALPQEVSEHTGRIHTTYSQTIAATGRLSSNNPNLQNIPIRTEKGREIRKAFVPKNEQHLLLSADYSQIELRIIAALSGDKNMQQAFQEGKDIHTATAAKVFKVDEKDVTREMRGSAKAVNFGIIYGVSAFGLSQNINISRKEAREMIDAYFEQYPLIKKFMDDSIESARKNGYVETIKNRRRHLRDINSSNAIVRGASERNAINAPIQGSAADVIKLAMINIQNKLIEGQYQSKMLLQVHDELVFDAHKDELEKLKQMVKHEMENAVQLDVPLEVEMDAALNWLEAH